MSKQRRSTQSARSSLQQKLQERSMGSESQWPGDAIAAPFCPAYGREDAFFESLGGRSWARVDRRADQLDADPTPVVLQNWRDAAINPAPAGSAPSSQRPRRRASVITQTARTGLAGWR